MDEEEVEKSFVFTTEISGDQEEEVRRVEDISPSIDTIIMVW